MDNKLIILWMFVMLNSWKNTDGQRVHKAPPKLIQLSIGSDLTLSWCVPARVKGTDPDGIFFLKNPSCITVQADKCKLAKKEGNSVTILPGASENIYKSLFSPSQITVYESNCTTNDEDILQTNYTLVIRNLSKSQARTYRFVGDYPTIQLGNDNETKVEFYVLPSIVLISTKTVNVGDQVTLNCIPSGIPLPKIKWTKVGGGDTVLSYNSVWTVSNSIRRESNGTYICTADNDIGNTAQKKIDLIVYYLDVLCSVKFDNNTLHTPQLLMQVSGNVEDYNCSGWNCNGINDLENINSQRSLGVSVLGKDGTDFGFCNVTAQYENIVCKNGHLNVTDLFVVNGPDRITTSLVVPSKGKTILSLNRTFTDAEITKFKDNICSGGGAISSSLAAILIVFSIMNVIRLLT